MAHQPVAAFVPVSTPAVRHLALIYGTLTQGELNNYLDIVSADSEDRKQEIKRSWPVAADAFQNLVASEAGLPESVATSALPPEMDDYLRNVRKNPAFAKTFANYPISFEYVEIDKLVAGQRTVHLDWVGELIKKGRPDNIAEFCLDPGQDSTPITIARSGNTAFTASSRNPSMRFLGVFENPFQDDGVLGHHPGGQPAHAIVLLLGYGISTINAYRVNRRLILGNGFHRLYALKALGLTHAPAVVQRVTHPQLEMPAVLGELPREHLVNTIRPGLMKDFFDERLVCEITQKSFIKTIQVAWGTNDALVPVPA
jgi:hypothetical protein